MGGPFWISRRATIDVAVNSEKQINTDYDGNTPGLLVPAQVSRITQIIVAIGSSIVAVASAGVTIALRLKGAGVAAQQDIVVGANREDTTSTGGTKLPTPLVLSTDIPVNPGQALSLAALQGGVDPGSPEIGVSLLFE